MPFDLPPFRPPSEAHSLLIRATQNCPWNKCTFCGMYKGCHFGIRSVDEVKRDILFLAEQTQAIVEWAWRAGYGNRIGDLARYNGIPWLENDGVKRAFIGDSNSIEMKTDQLAQIVEFLYIMFPTLERVTSYGRAKTAVRKSVADLKRLKEAGLTRIHVGLESGDDEVLAFVQKGATAAEMIEGGRKIVEAGISLSEYVLLGLGGKARTEQQAEETARVLNAINPDFIRIRTLNVGRNTPLYESVQQGEFQPLSAEEMLREERRLIERLEVTSQYVGDHVSNYLELEGKLPEDKERMLARIDALLEALPELSYKPVRFKREGYV